jgi:hypothetical protein
MPGSVPCFGQSLFLMNKRRLSFTGIMQPAYMAFENKSHKNCKRLQLE